MRKLDCFPGQLFDMGDVIQDNATKNTGKVIKIERRLDTNNNLKNSYYIGWTGSAIHTQLDATVVHRTCSLHHTSMEPNTCDHTIENVNMINCDHKWKDYQGLRKSYEYCEKCDERRDI